VFGSFGWDGPIDSPTLAACREQGALGVVLSGLSKACGLPQLKLGWMILAGPAHLVGEARERLEVVADTSLSVGTPVQNGLPRLLEIGDELAGRILERVRGNVRELRATGAVLPADGGWSAVLPLPDGAQEQSVVGALLREERVLVHPGWLFDLPLPSLVVSLLTPPDEFAAGLRAVRRLGG